MKLQHWLPQKREHVKTDDGTSSYEQAGLQHLKCANLPLAL